MKGVVYLGDSKVEVRDFPRPERGTQAEDIIGKNESTR